MNHGHMDEVGLTQVRANYAQIVKRAIYAKNGKIAHIHVHIISHMSSRHTAMWDSLRLSQCTNHRYIG